MTRPRLSYNVAVYHRTFGGPDTGPDATRLLGLPPCRSPARRGRHRVLAPTRAPTQPAGVISPGVVFLAIALVGSVVYVAYAVTVRDASQIPLLASGAVVLGIVFVALAGYCLRATWRAGIDGRDGRAIALGVVGGIAAIVAAGCAAGAIILFLLINAPV